MSKRFEGIFAALTTPFVNNEQVSIEKFRENILKFNQTTLAGYNILGSTAECVFLSDEESEVLVKTARETASSEKKVLAGTTKESTRLTLEFTNRMADLGIEAALVRPPSYYKSRMDPQTVKAHFFAVADKSKVPLIIYNIPQNTGINIDSSLILELANHQNIVGIKDSSGNLNNLGESLPGLRPEFSFLLGAGSLILPGLVIGACGAILAVANAIPAECARIYDLYLQGKIEEARKLQLDITPLNKAVIQTYGIPALKYALDLRGFYGGLPRPPLLPLGDRGKSEIETILKNLGLHLH